jgi:hypothetical protein
MGDTDTPRFFKNPFTSTYCEMFNCTDRATWLMGRPNDASLVMPGSIRLCDRCAASVVQNLPHELMPHELMPQGQAPAEAKTAQAPEDDTSGRSVGAAQKPGVHRPATRTAVKK